MALAEFASSARLAPADDVSDLLFCANKNPEKSHLRPDCNFLNQPLGSLEVCSENKLK